MVGVGSLLTQLARCCRPAPPDAIAGFVTRGRGVSIHRRDCHSYLALAEREPERVIEVAWGETSDTFYPVDISVRAHDRSGLLRDLSEVFARLRLNVVGVNTQSRQSLAHMVFTVEVRGGESLTRALDAWPRSRACRRPSGAERQVPPPGKDGGRTTRARRRTDLSGPGCRARGRA